MMRPGASEGRLRKMHSHLVIRQQLIECQSKNTVGRCKTNDNSTRKDREIFPHKKIRCSGGIFVAYQHQSVCIGVCVLYNVCVNCTVKRDKCPSPAHRNWHFLKKYSGHIAAPKSPMATDPSNFYVRE